MVVSQIGNGDFPLNNCAVLRGVLEPKQIDFIQSFLRGDALSNPIADLAGGVKSTISEAVSGLQGIGSFTENPDGTPGGFVQAPWASNLQNVVQDFQGSIVEFEQRTNRISGVVSGFQDDQPDLGRILGIGSAYNSALATLSTNPEDIFKDNFSHGFNSLKQEFGVNAIQEAQNVLDGIVQFAGQFGAGDFDPGDNQFFDEIIRITTTIQGIEQSFLNIANSEDAFLSGALAFLDQYGLANTALSGVLTDPCLAGKVFKDLIAGPGIEGLIPDLQLPSPPSLDQIAELIPDPEELVDDIKASVEGIVESVQQQAEQLIDSVVDKGKDAVNKLEKSFEDLQSQGEQLVAQAEQAAADLATNISEFGSNVEDFFSDEEEEVVAIGAVGDDSDGGDTEPLASDIDIAPDVDTVIDEYEEQQATADLRAEALAAIEEADRRYTEEVSDILSYEDIAVRVVTSYINYDTRNSLSGGLTPVESLPLAILTKFKQRGIGGSLRGVGPWGTPVPYVDGEESYSSRRLRNLRRDLQAHWLAFNFSFEDLRKTEEYFSLELDRVIRGSHKQIDETAKRLVRESTEDPSFTFGNYQGQDGIVFANFTGGDQIRRAISIWNSIPRA